MIERKAQKNHNRKGYGLILLVVKMDGKSGTAEDPRSITDTDCWTRFMPGSECTKMEVIGHPQDTTVTVRSNPLIMDQNNGNNTCPASLNRDTEPKIELVRLLEYV